MLLDGAVGTELNRRGIRTKLPLWSAHALTTEEGVAVLTGIHTDYARAGAQVLLTNTFRTNRRVLTEGGQAKEWRELNRRAVEAAKEGARAADGTCLVAGSLAPLEDCYRPDLVPPQDECVAEHRQQAGLLAELGCDLLWIETMNCARESIAALEAAKETGLDIVLSLCPKSPAHLLSGEPFEEVVSQLVEVGGGGLSGLLLNCATPEVMAQAYPELARLAGNVPHGFYAHMGEPDDTVGWKLPPEGDPEPFAAATLETSVAGTRYLGGCCGTQPAHIAALQRALGKHAGRA